MVSRIWTFIFFAMYMQASILRTICFPLMYHDDNWKERLDAQLKIYQKNYQDIFLTSEKFLQNLFENRVSNAFKALPIYLDQNWNDNNNNNNNNRENLIQETTSYLKQNFGKDRSSKEFCVFVVSSTNVYYRSPDLFYYSKGDNRSVVVGMGKMWTKYSCDEYNELMVKVKLTCFKIGDSHISYHGENVTSFDLS